ncbi:aspartyl protease family protein 1-like [Typha latifolia]|uniref:aspartyl protease family protein 1-like n=1 Tax=Typha latifolia TaxID=4733 RepID=UPI003C2B80D8
MDSSSFYSSLLLLLFFFAGTNSISLDFHHRFSDQVRRWAQYKNHPGALFPEKDTSGYYSALAHHDRALHRRLLSSSDELTFVDGNATVAISSLGYLHYAVVALGTPNATFLVALDTGSDLFWVPCDCKQCAPTSSPEYGLGNLEFSTYSPSLSSTSQNVSCSSNFCNLQNSCSGGSSSCSYLVQYVSDNTSSSGVLVEDVLYLTTEANSSEVIEASIVFGCGQVQSGSFLDGAAPDGLLGLGMDKISVPSILSSKGLASNSFSMCFGSDGNGRINFGDKGSSDQEETPFDINSQNQSYNISITGARVGNSSISAEFSAIVDSGTSFTYLTDPVYTQLTDSFNSQVQESRHESDSSIPFDYCYDLSFGQTISNVPEMNLVTKNGSLFPVTSPIIAISSQTYCLAILNSSDINIIGQNFLTGLLVVFDRERLILGWQKFDCYDVENSTTLPVNGTGAYGPSSYNPAEETPSNTHVTVLTPSSNHASNLIAMKNIFFTLFLLAAAIV